MNNSLGVYSVIVRLEPRGEAKSTAELYLSGKGLYFLLAPVGICAKSIMLIQSISASNIILLYLLLQKLM